MGCWTVAVPMALALVADSAPSRAQEPSFSLAIKDHRFAPAELTVPSGQRIKLVVENQDPVAEEFESHDLHVEKVVGGGKSITVLVGPLKPGSYSFVGERHEDTAKGTLVAQ
jgi:plastocyanin